MIPSNKREIHEYWDSTALIHKTEGTVGNRPGSANAGRNHIRCKNETSCKGHAN